MRPQDSHGTCAIHDTLHSTCRLAVFDTSGSVTSIALHDLHLRQQHRVDAGLHQEAKATRTAVASYPAVQPIVGFGARSNCRNLSCMNTLAAH